METIGTVFALLIVLYLWLFDDEPESAAVLAVFLAIYTVYLH
jgi:hypothetical protein